MIELSARKFPPLMQFVLQVRQIGASLFAVGNLGRAGACVRSDDGGESWTPICQGLPGLRQVWGASADDVFCVGEYGTVVHVVRSGGVDVVTHLPSPGSGCLFGVLSDAAGRLLVSGDNGISRCADGRWQHVVQTRGLARLYRTPGGNIAIGDGGALWRQVDDDGFEKIALGTKVDIYGALALDERRLLLCGDGGALWHFDGRTAHPLESGTDGRLLAFAVAGSDIFVVGNDSFVGIVDAVDIDGASVTPVPLPTKASLWSACVSTDGVFWAAGERGALFCAPVTPAVDVFESPVTTSLQPAATDDDEEEDEEDHARAEDDGSEESSEDKGDEDRSEEDKDDDSSDEDGDEDDF